MRKTTSGNGDLKRDTSPASTPAQESATEHAAGLAEKMKAVEAPVVHASSSQINIMGNDAVMVLSRWRPAINPSGTAPSPPIVETTAIIHLSMATMKDLSVTMADAVAAFEKQFGEIQTDFLRRRAAAKQ